MTTLTLEVARQRVARGAHHLDRMFPDWATRIDIGTLELNCEENCVLGQLYGNFWDAVHAVPVFRKPGDEWFVADLPVRYGFVLAYAELVNADSFGAEPGYQRLQDAWVEAIAARVAQPAVETTEVPACV